MVNSSQKINCIRGTVTPLETQILEVSWVKYLSNFKRGRGDNMGIAGKLNDNAEISAPVFSYWPNDYGLYNMSGNVSEWVMDVYQTTIT